MNETRGRKKESRQLREGAEEERMD
jgi:ribosomal protein L4